MGSSFSKPTIYEPIFSAYLNFPFSAFNVGMGKKLDLHTTAKVNLSASIRFFNTISGEVILGIFGAL